MVDTQFCPFCGKEILAVAKKCKYCNQWLEQECPFCAETIPANSKVCPQCNSNIEHNQASKSALNISPEDNRQNEEFMICKFCGSKVSVNCKKCKYCGEWLVTPDKDKPKGDWHLGAWIEGIIVLIMIIIMFATSFEYNDGVGLCIFIIYIALHLYFLPSLIADKKRTKYTGAIFALNLLLGATVIVWVACLVWALILPDLTKNNCNGIKDKD